ncbi:prohibitin family protein [Candidatus Dependentiae bacterium]|nr:prohibitin family protein [Candidatus Dependentiae bacterium]
MEERNIAIFGFLTVLGALLAWTVYSNAPFYIVEPGQTALHLRLGRFVQAHEVSGCYFKMPAIDSVIYINNRICKTVIETTALSKDLQFVSIGVAINYKINNAIELYKTVGTDFEKVIIDPFAQESIKAVVAKYTAEDLIQFRHDAKEKVYSELKSRLLPLNITLIDFNFVHSDFSPDFIKAVEEKQIAEQSAKTAKNLTEKVKEEVIQTRSRADAEAYSLKIKKESVTAELIALKKAEALIKAIEKWDGKLPHVSGGNTPFINLNDI